MKSRPGVTLIEVLMAIFIMGIGLLALLTLFPVGAVTMTAAMSDARCAEAGYNAKSVCFTQGLMFDPINVTPLYRNGIPGVSTPLPPEWNGPSYPVFSDPVGINYIVLSAPYNTQLSANFPRANTLYGGAALSWYSLQDDYQYDANGSTSLPTGVERESRYTYAYVFRLPNVREPAVVDVSVIVYQGRNLQVPNIGENAYSVVTVTGTRSFVIQYAGTKPNIKKGGWVLDTTSFNLNDPNQLPLAQKYGPVPGTFYRVTDATDLVINGTPCIEIETQMPLVNLNIGTIMVLDNVAEVFPVGTGWKQ